MRTVILIIAFVVSTTLLIAQQPSVTLIDRLLEGSFELGATFSENGWVAANGSQRNTWHVGTVAPVSHGSNAAFISPDGGESWGYVFGLTVVYFYRDITFPSNSLGGHLSFQVGHTSPSLGDDIWLVYLVDPSTPVTGGEFFEARILSSARFREPHYTVVNVPISSTDAFGSKRLVFAWFSHHGGGTAASIDEISLVAYLSGEPMWGEYTVDPRAPLQQGNFIYLGQAITALNLYGVSAQTALKLMSGETYHEVISPLRVSGTSTMTITITSANPDSPATLMSLGLEEQRAGMAMVGTDYVTISNLRLQQTPNGTPLDYGIYVTNGSPTDGAQYNRIRDVAIDMGGGGVGLALDLEHTPSEPGGTNSSNQIESVTVENANSGLWLSGDHSHADSGNSITSSQIVGYKAFGIKASYQVELNISDNRILEGASLTPDSLHAILIDNREIQNRNTVSVISNSIHSATSSGGPTTGILVRGSEKTNLELRRNELDDLAGSSVVGLKVHGLDNGLIQDNFFTKIQGTGTALSGPIATGILALSMGTITVENNRIDGVRTDPSPNPAVACGIAVENTEIVSITENHVSGVKTESFSSNLAAGFFLLQFFHAVIANNAFWSEPPLTGIGDAWMYGIEVENGGGTVTENGERSPRHAGGVLGTLEIYFNTIRIGSGNPNVRSTCLNLNSPGTVNQLRNNIFANFSGPQSGTRKHYAIKVGSNTSLGADGSTSDRNVLHIANQANGFVGGGPTVDYPSLAAWRNAYSHDSNSFAHDPQFISSTNFHINPELPTPASNNASPILGIVKDIDGDGRDPAMPDIGADEGEFTGLFTHDVMPRAFINPLEGEVKASNTSFSPVASFFNPGASNESSVPVRFTIIGPLPSTGLVYDQTSTVSLSAGEGVIQATFPSTTIGTPGIYSLTVSTELSSDQNPANDQRIAVFEVGGPYAAGTYKVGNDQPEPFNTLSGAVRRLNIVGIDGPITILLDQQRYSESESFPIVIKAVPGSSETNTVTIRPTAALALRGGSQYLESPTTIEGSSITSILKFEDAGNIIIDGSAKDGSDRSLRVVNTSTGSPRAVFWLSSSGAGGGCKNIVIKNVIMSCGADMSTSSTAFQTFGIISGGTTISDFSAGNGNDNNMFMNNEITRVSYGIHVRGATGNPNDNNVISRNIIGPQSHGPDQIGRAGIAVKAQINLRVIANVVRFVGGALDQTAGGIDRVGIGVGADGWQPVATVVTNSTISGNLIHDIVDERLNGAVGIIIAGLGTGGPPVSNNLVSNNMISGIRSNGTSTGNQAVGIGIGSGNSDRIVFNTISLEGDLDPEPAGSASQSAVGIRISSPTTTNLTLKNNIVAVDVSSNIPTLKHFGVVVPSSDYAWGTGGSNHNNIYVQEGNEQTVLGGHGSTVPYAEVKTLEEWRLLFNPGGQDSNSVAKEVHFLSSSNLHLEDPSASDPSMRGAPIPGVIDDFDGDMRDVATPFIGADEPVSQFLSVNLVSFTGKFSPQTLDVVLSWSTFGEVRNAGFFIERRKETDADFSDLSDNFVAGRGTTSSPFNYTFRDSTLTENGLYHYRLRQVDSANVATYLDTVSIQVTVTGVAATTPNEYFLSQNHPNPFNPVTTIRFGIRDAGYVTLRIYDVLGQEVAVLVNEKLPSGVHTRIWDAGDLPSGMYYYRMTAGGFNFVRKSLLIK